MCISPKKYISRFPWEVHMYVGGSQVSICPNLYITYTTNFIELGTYVGSSEVSICHYALNLLKYVHT
jgi:hypothetical protein